MVREREKEHFKARVSASIGKNTNVIRINICNQEFKLDLDENNFKEMVEPGTRIKWAEGK